MIIKNLPNGAQLIDTVKNPVTGRQIAYFAKVKKNSSTVVVSFENNQNDEWLLLDESRHTNINTKAEVEALIYEGMAELERSEM